MLNPSLRIAHRVMKTVERKAEFLAGLWNRPLSETHLPTIAAKIEEWRVISPFLGLSAVHNSTILGEAPHSVPTQRVAMLRRWKQLLGKRATYEKLRQAFVRCGRTDLVEIVQQLVTSSENTAAERIEKDEHQQLPVTGNHDN